MSLESLGKYLNAGAKRSLQRTQQAFQVAQEVRHLTGIEVKVIIRDKLVVLEVSSAARATKLMLHQVKIDQIIESSLGRSRLAKIKVGARGA